MSADSSHHMVEQGMRKKRNIQGFQNFIEVVDKCGQALVMKFDDFYHIPKGVSSGNFALRKPKLATVQICKFERGSEKIFWKTSFDQKDFQKPFSCKKRYSKTLGNDFEKVDRPRGVYPAKKNNIINVLCPFMDIQRRKFWHDLSTNENSVDLVTERIPLKQIQFCNESVHLLCKLFV